MKNCITMKSIYKEEEFLKKTINSDKARFNMHIVI